MTFPAVNVRNSCRHFEPRTVAPEAHSCSALLPIETHAHRPLDWSDTVSLIAPRSTSVGPCNMQDRAASNLQTSTYRRLPFLADGLAFSSTRPNASYHWLAMRNSQFVRRQSTDANLRTKAAKSRNAACNPILTAVLAINSDTICILQTSTNPGAQVRQAIVTLFPKVEYYRCS